MTLHGLNLIVCKAAFVEEYFKELEESKTEKNFARTIDAAIHSESESHVHRALEMIRANIASNEGNKTQLYYQLGVGLCRIGDGEGAKKALEECLQIDESLWKARSLLENVELILRADEPKNTISKSKLLKLGASVGGLVLGAACTMIFSSEELIEFAGGMKKAGELGESIEKMTVTNGNKAGLGIARCCCWHCCCDIFHWLEEVVIGLRSVDG